MRFFSLKPFKMKKVTQLSYLIVLLLALVVCQCAKPEEQPVETEKAKLLTTGLSSLKIPVEATLSFNIRVD